MRSFSHFAAAAAGALLLAEPIIAHSWVEQLMRISANGTMTGAAGYIRGFVSRADAGFSDDKDNYLIPPNGRVQGNAIFATDSLCHPSQRVANYSSTYPMLSAASGDFIALRYQENGHVTLPDVNPTKPLNRGTAYVYGTTQPSDNELFEDVFSKWNADGTGGNGRGRLLATRNFDDQQCYQVNGGDISTTRQSKFTKTAENPQGSDLWCQNDIQLPSDLGSGSTYTLYWVWSWPTMDKAGAPTDQPGDGFNVTTLQYYTSCMDVSITGSSSAAGNAKAVKASFSSSYAQGQDLNNAAILSQLTAGAFEVSVPSTNGSDSSDSAGSASSQTSTAAATRSSGTTTITAAVSTTQKGGDVETIVVTVTQTQAPVYVTVTKGASGSSSSTVPVSTIHVTSTIRPALATRTQTASTTKTPAPSVVPFLARRVSRVRRHL